MNTFKIASKAASRASHLNTDRKHCDLSILRVRHEKRLVRRAERRAGKLLIYDGE